jgi:hypothetical protein
MPKRAMACGDGVMLLGRVGLMSVAIVVTLAGCGGGDDGNVVSERAIVTTTVAETTIPCPADDSASTTVSGVIDSCVDFEDSEDSGDDVAVSTGSGGSGGGAVAGVLPDACSLLSTGSVASAIGGTAAPSQHQKPNEISSQCDWSLGQPHSLSLVVRAGSNAENTFNNTFTEAFAVPLPPPLKGGMELGARESARDYRLVILEAYDGTYYVHLTLQGPDRDDAAATQAATALVQEVYANLG